MKPTAEYHAHSTVSLPSLKISSAVHHSDGTNTHKLASGFN